MGQHKHNPTAIKAKNGEIKPKKTGNKNSTEKSDCSCCKIGTI